jgi:hypothetical protein
MDEDRPGSENIKEIPLSWIVQDPKIQGRHKGVKPHVARKYADMYRRGTIFPPITVVQDGDAYLLADGWHRVAALEIIGQNFAEANVIEGNARTAMKIASTANMTHGLPQTAADIRRCFQLYMRSRAFLKENGQPKSTREIAEEFHHVRAHTTIWRWIRERFPKSFAAYYIKEMPTGDSAFGTREVTDILDPYEKQATHAIEQALAAFRGVTDPLQRGTLIEMVEDLLKIMKSDGPWDKPDF